MTDEKLGLDLARWMKDAEFAPTDASRSAHQVATRLPQTRQLGRRWWLPSSKRTQAIPPTTDQTTEYQPTPILATNGQSATVTGRTQSMFTPVKAITAGALVFAIGGVLLIAQPFDQQSSVPGAAIDDESMTPALVTGFLVYPEDSPSSELLPSYEKTEVDGIARGRWLDTADVEMSDPRLSGAFTNDYSVERFDDLATDLGWGTVRVENDAGFWEGQSVHTTNIAARGEVAYYELVGHGAFDGLSAVVFETETSSGKWALSGIIFPGSQPPNR